MILGLDGLIADNGPVFARREPDGSVVFGCRIMPNMCNPMGVAHGGWLATLCDVGLPLTGRLTDPELAGQFMLTVHLAVDYMRGPRLGEWVECHGRLLKRTKRLVFIDGLLTVGDEVAARASGVFRTGIGGPEVQLADLPSPA